MVMIMEPHTETTLANIYLYKLRRPQLKSKAVSHEGLEEPCVGSRCSKWCSEVAIENSKRTMLGKKQKLWTEKLNLRKL